MIERRTIAGLIAAALAAGCSLTPQYTRPDAPVAAAYPADPSGKGSREAVDIGWREFFPDQHLQALIKLALDNNRDLRTAALRMQEARAQYNVQSADLLPNLNLNASGSRVNTPGNLSLTGQRVIATNYQVGLGMAAFELDFLGRVRSLNEAALGLYLASEEARQAAQIGLIAEVAKAALAVRAFAEQQELAQRTLDGRETAYKLARQRFDVGATSALDLRLNETLVLSARAALATLARQRAQAANSLTLLTGAAPADLPALRPLAAQDIVAELPAGMPSDLLMRRPDIRAAEQRLKSANANIGAARAAFFPRITLTAGAGTASSMLSGLFRGGSDTWSFAPQLVLPIFDAGRNRSNLDLAEVRKNLAVVDYEKAIQTAFREVSDALVARGAIDQQLEAQRATVEAQADRLRLAELRFNNGVASSLDVLDAQRELFTAEQTLVQTRLLRLTNSIDLYRALGGGVRETGGSAGG